jgi:ABC-type phosphate transport system substrate-binding protein
MKIELDQQEIIAILTNWAKSKYGTHNVSVERLGSGTATMQVTMSDNDFGTSATKITMEKFGELAKQMKFKGDVVPLEGDVVLPNYDNVTLDAV